VIEIAKSHNIEIIEKRVELAEIHGFTECFVTGTALEVKKVNSIDLGNKKIVFREANITNKIQAEFASLVRM
jgi:branched-chain amino acid aminotransferase